MGVAWDPIKDEFFVNDRIGAHLQYAVQYTPCPKERCHYNIIVAHNLANC